MHKYNPDIHHRRSIRFKEYDYTQAGLYYVTICIKNREYLFGDISNGELTLNDAGQMIEKWHRELENKFPDIQCHEMVVMPNHFHCIIENVGHNVGADLRVCPDDENGQLPENGQSHIIAPTINEREILGEHIGSPLHRVVQWFKTMTTNEYIRGVKTKNWQPFDGKLWQRNYWEHIIRNETSHQTISEYIINNPAKWNDDKFNPYNKEVSNAPQ